MKLIITISGDTGETENLPTKVQRGLELIAECDWQIVMMTEEEDSSGVNDFTDPVPFKHSVVATDRPEDF